MQHVHAILDINEMAEKLQSGSQNFHNDITFIIHVENVHLYIVKTVAFHQAKSIRNKCILYLKLVLIKHFV